MKVVFTFDEHINNNMRSRQSSTLSSKELLRVGCTCIAAHGHVAPQSKCGLDAGVVSAMLQKGKYIQLDNSKGVSGIRHQPRRYIMQSIVENERVDSQ